MVVDQVEPALDLGYAGLFLGLRVNELVMAGAERGGFAGLRESHGYVIQHLVESGRSISELARRMEVTQQAASKAVAELQRLEVVEVLEGESRREKRVQLSAHGWRAVRQGRAARRRIEQKLKRVVGCADYDMARAILLRCLAALGGIERVRRRRIRAPR
jgi:DNA-binding MarR family transcriptional regulator